MEKKKETIKFNETHLLCPVCGAELILPEHEHAVGAGTAIGKDSALGTVYMPMTKRGQERINALKEAGIDTSAYFSIATPSGDDQLMRWENGKPVAVSDDDPTLASIISGGAIPDRRLFRRWVMSQVFHALAIDVPFDTWVKWKTWHYQWTMLAEELRVQAVLYGKDMENYEERNLWFNANLVAEMLRDYISELNRHIKHLKRRKCKGRPYVTLSGKHYFEADIEKEVFRPLYSLFNDVNKMKNAPTRLSKTVSDFVKNTLINLSSSKGARFSKEWLDAYKGMGAYATMKNLLLFHGCQFPEDSGYFNPEKSDIEMLRDAAYDYRYEGWRLFGLMKHVIQHNGIDIKAKRREWREAKQARHKA